MIRFAVKPRNPRYGYGFTVPNPAAKEKLEENCMFLVKCPGFDASAGND